MAERKAPVPILWLGHVEVGERCYSVELDRKFPGPHELRFVIGDQGPLPLPWDVPTVSAPVRLSLDGGENWWEGDATVASWRVETIGQRIVMYGTFSARAEPFRPPEVHDDRRLSALLFRAREYVDMLADIVQSRAGKPATDALAVRDEIDRYRAERGWSPHGFGNEP